MPLVAHISDLHLLSLEGVSPLDLMIKRITGAINLLFNRGGEYPVEVARLLVKDVAAQQPDQVVVTGDVTNLSLEPELRLVGDVLDELGMPPGRVTLVPGNHDCYTQDAADRELFSAELGRYLRGDLQPGPGHFPYLHLGCEGLAVVAMSSARVSPPFLALGTLGSRQLRQAEELLMHAKCRGRFRLIALHHPPGGPHDGWDKRLTDNRELTAMIRRVGAEMVVHGHIHQFSHQTLPGPLGEIPVVSCSSSTWLSPKDPERRAQYNLYEISGKSLVRLRVRRLDSAGEAFVEVERPGAQ